MTIEQYIDNLNRRYKLGNATEHTFRGDIGGGVHHISALVADPNMYKLAERIPTNMGCYKAKILKPDGTYLYNKDFFPDEWDELRVIDEIKIAWGNKVEKPEWGSGMFLGHSSPPENIPIEIKVDGNKLKTAYPRW